MKSQVSKLCQAAYYHLHLIRSITDCQTQQATELLVHVLVISRLHYGNSLLYGLPYPLLDKLQRVQNTAARVVVKASRYDHLTPMLDTLPWLLVRYRIQYKTILKTYKASHLLALTSTICSSTTSQAEHCDCHQNPYWFYTGHFCASSVNECSVSLLHTYGTIYHAVCEHLIQYTSSKDSLKL